MFISVIKKMVPYFIVSAFCLVFSLIYEHFSHNVTSVYMLYAFIIPLLAGIIKIVFRKLLSSTLYRASWITLLIYSYLKGVLEIFGTTNNLLPIFLYVSIGLLILSILLRLYINKNYKKRI